MNEAALRITRARTALVLAHPFFATLVLRLTLREDAGCDTAWTDGQVLAYNPDYVTQLPMDELTGLCAHIVMHPVCGHHLHRHGRDSFLWNRACDYAINWILLDSGITLPRGYLHDERYRNKNADQIYTLLLKKQLREEKQTADSPQTVADGIGLGSGNSLQDGDSTSDELQSTSEDPSAEEQDYPEQPIEQPPSAGDPGMSGEVRDFDPPSQGGDKSEPGDGANDWQMALAQATNQARDMGKLPGALSRLVEELLEPQLDWQDILLRFLDQAARNDYSWMPPNRRHIHDGLYLPSMNSEQLREIVIVADTSGSISQSDFDFLAAELSAILEVNAVRVSLLYCDAKVVDWQQLAREDLPLDIQAKGGGGTDFRPAFEWVEEQAISPACLIYLSDMICDKFPAEPDYPVLWARIGGSGVEPPFGETLEINIDQEAA